ncbi:hypothetical protein MRB53_023926 [Persea americana]|uniref:Uncharacterized protein n=1 Tax=Persea americana TaxID=3435 RepID=A0ACC2LBQ0_PERAE|nr:hypothetical protein MRB53_023926 [Persea americana]
MKGGIFNGLRGKSLSLILIIVICVAVPLWYWEKTPLVTFLPQQNRLEILSPVIPTDASAKNSTHLKDREKGNVEEGFSNAGREKEHLIATVVETRSGQEEKGFQIAPVGSVPASFPEERKGDDGLMTPPVEEKGCNYAKGKWIADSRWPLYSGFECKQWLSSMWACRLTQRTDFDYEGFRWQPENCEMRAFDGSTFLKRMQDKTFALVGDSLGRQQFQSLMCMVTGGKDSPEVENVGWKYGLVKARGAIRPDGWAYLFPRTNTTILFYCITSIHSTFWCSIQGTIGTELPQHPRLKAFFRTLSPRHFFNGDWNTGGSCNNSIPLAGGDTVSQDESRDPVVAGAVKGTRVKLLDITALSQLRDEGHMSQISVPGKESSRLGFLPDIKYPIK